MTQAPLSAPLVDHRPRVNGGDRPDLVNLVERHILHGPGQDGSVRLLYASEERLVVGEGVERHLGETRLLPHLDAHALLSHHGVQLGRQADIPATRLDGYRHVRACYLRRLWFGGGTLAIHRIHRRI